MSDESSYTEWSLGEIIDQMIRLRTKNELNDQDRGEYQDLIRELDRRGEASGLGPTVTAGQAEANS
ncbi:MAG: hypothetical protein HY722_03125 [Planctomycetes bacterium]|nr:hypothetical protein [Planctomycetota bacterium]